MAFFGRDFTEVFNDSPFILMEGALGERLKHEYGIGFDDNVALAGLVYEDKGKSALESLWREYISAAEKYDLPFIATTPTRRVNRDRVGMSEYDSEIIAENVSFLRSVLSRAKTGAYAGGLVGCKGDAYLGTEPLSINDSEEFHSWETELFAAARIDFFFAGIMPVATEAAGLARAIERTGLPYIISFMVRADGRLPDGTALSEAIEYVDAATRYHPLCYMTNCVHPANLKMALSKCFNRTETVRSRFCGIQANASPLSPEELDGAPGLYTTDPVTLAEDIISLRENFPLKIAGGCCGTSGPHIVEIAKRAAVFYPKSE